MKKIIPNEIARYINMTGDMVKRKENVVYEDELFICVKDIKHKTKWTIIIRRGVKKT